MSEETPEPEPPNEETREDAKPAPPPVPWWSRRAIWALLVTALVGVAGIAGAWKVDRIEHDPNFCESCHVGSTKASHASEHKGQKCIDCHENRYDQNVRQWVYGLYSSTKTTPHGKFVPATCKKCHTGGNTETWHMAKSLGHVKHVIEGEKPLDCTKCHVWKAHEVEPDPDACGKCHDDIQIYGRHKLEGKPEKIGCVSCHNYLSKVGGGAQTPSHDCRRCHGGVEKSERSQRYATVIEAKGIPPSQIHGNLKACSLCHSPHEKDPQAHSKGSECSRCHAKITVESHETRDPAKFDCASCHEAHGNREDLKTGCHECHEAQAKLPKSVAMRHDRCAECHKPHDFKATYAGCRDCHDDQTDMLASWRSNTHAECTNCHKPHSAKAEEKTCITCHQKPGHRHKSCTSCHDPHQSKTATKACGGCHAQHAGAVERGPAKHKAQVCGTCHQPHSMANTGAACKGCHTKQIQLVSSAKVDKHTRCKSCHQTHSFSADVAACKTCHKNPDTGVHTGKCSDCHAVHGPPVGKAAQCRNCHQEIAQPAGKHTQCDSCHKSAHGEVKSKPCTGCHGTQEASVKSWKAKTHEGCPQCHQTHTPTAPKPCGQCHKAQDMKMQRGKHRCTSCHDAHRAPPSDLWAGCSSCHANQVAGVVGRGPKHSTCKSCHQQHDVTPPTCASCHKALPRLHTEKGHEKCAACHDSHKKKFPSRAECLKCHTTRQNHNPNAQHCYGCHIFNSK